MRFDPLAGQRPSRMKPSSWAALATRRAVTVSGSVRAGCGSKTVCG
jgi:hypothetical protein